MSLLFYPFDSLSLRDPFDDLLLASPYGPPAMARAPSCGRAACAPRAAAACGPRRQSCPPPAEPEVHLTRHEDGVVAECLLGRGFDERDIRCASAAAAAAAAPRRSGQPSSTFRLCSLCSHLAACPLPCAASSWMAGTSS